MNRVCSGASGGPERRSKVPVRMETCQQNDQLDTVVRSSIIRTVVLYFRWASLSRVRLLQSKCVSFASEALRSGRNQYGVAFAWRTAAELNLFRNLKNLKTSLSRRSAGRSKWPFDGRRIRRGLFVKLFEARIPMHTHTIRADGGGNRSHAGLESCGCCCWKN